VPICYKVRYKLVFLSLVLAVLGTGCSNEIKKKDFAAEGSKKDVCAADATNGNKFFCLESALKTDCANHPEQCGQEKFLNDGYGGFAYPQPVLTFFNDMYSEYLNQYYSANKILPAFRHFGDYFGLIYNDVKKDKPTPADVDPNQLPVGIVGGGTISSGAIIGTAYDSESCALCHFGIGNDGFYRFGIANNQLKYGGLKLAFNRFICYAEAKADTEYANLPTRCATANLPNLVGDEIQQCKAYQAFMSSSANASLLALWNDKTFLSDDKRKQLLDDVKNAVPNSRDSACVAASQLLPAYSHEQVIELSKWDGIHYPDGTIIDTNTSRIDRFYHSVMTADGMPRTTINDGVHAPVKIPVLGNLVPAEKAAVGDYSGKFLSAGVVSTLQQYVRLHAALEGGDNSVGMDDAALAPLMQFLASLELPKSDVAATTLNSAAYFDGQSLFNNRCSGCHDEQQKLVNYPQDVGTDFTYATALIVKDVVPRTVQQNIKDLTPAYDVWNDALDGSIKQPRLHGLWAARSFLHNGMSYSLANLFCLTGSINIRDATYTTGTSAGSLIHEAPFLDGGHLQTCAADLTADQRRDLITYLLTL